MPQCLADSRYGHVLALGYACPGVAGYVGGQGYGQAYHFSDFLQLLGDTAIGILVLSPEYGSLSFCYREQVGRIICFVLRHYLLNGRFPFDVQLL